MTEKTALTAWVPRSTADQVAERIEKRGFVSASDYLRALIREDLEKEGKV
ncbi:MAG: hypothetical protein ABIJ47_01550 [Candidatus Bathyarchaeota archaeon]